MKNNTSLSDEEIKEIRDCLLNDTEAKRLDAMLNLNYSNITQDGTYEIYHNSDTCCLVIYVIESDGFDIFKSEQGFSLN